ncbi:hypothetical protein [Streptomyces sp. 6N223]|uniref:hypothetical protein n=1 Tax=Streptomyces sp. 6N223 TaxID=3457412 RepID=UPI003FD10A72
MDTRPALDHVRWIGGGTGAGKSTVVALLARHHDVRVYDGDRGEAAYIDRATPERQPRLHALARMNPAEKWLARPVEEFYAEMPSLHGETFPLVVEDLLTLPAHRPVLVDDFRTLPRHVAPLLPRPEYAVFLLPTPDFRREALTRRYADPGRARANWGDADPAEMLRRRLARDELWDAEVRRQAREESLSVIDVDGHTSPEALAARLAAAFALT